MKNRLAVASLFTIVCGIFPLVAMGRPQWLTAPQKVYADGDYISAVGSGKDRAAAESSAKLALCQILGESISGEQKVTQHVSSSGQDESSIGISVTEQAVFSHITGIQIKESYSDKKGIVYALAVLSRKESAAYYSNKISEADIAVSRALGTAVKLRGTFASLGAIKTAREVSADNDYNLNLLAVISPQQRLLSNPSYGTSVQVRNRCTDLAAEIKICVLVQGDQAGRLAAAFSAVLRNAGVTVTPDTNAPYIIAATLSFEDAVSSDPRYQYIRYTLDAPLAERVSGTTVLPFSLTGREGHVTASQAQQRALVKIEDLVKTDYESAVENLLASY
jgi:hypothetical protein